jgi:hypothetical protein
MERAYYKTKLSFIRKILTGQFIFNHYRYRICKETRTRGIQDNVEHVLFKCPRWAVERAILESDIRAELYLGNYIIWIVVGKDEYRQRFTRFCATVMKACQAKERIIEKTNRRGRQRTYIPLSGNQ